MFRYCCLTLAAAAFLDPLLRVTMPYLNVDEHKTSETPYTDHPKRTQALHLRDPHIDHPNLFRCYSSETPYVNYPREERVKEASSLSSDMCAVRKLSMVEATSSELNPTWKSAAAAS